jgi:hypothetical protein
VNENAVSPREPTKVDAAASAACIRSGAFALLLSIANLLLVPYWREQPRYAALADYLMGRVDLASAIEGLDDDPIWQKYKTSNDAADSVPIAQLPRLQINIATDAATPGPQPKPAPSKNHQNARVTGLSSAAPSPPRMLSVAVTIGLPEAPRIVASLTKLNDSDTLTRTRQVSNFFNFSIIRWLNKRGAFVYRNVLASNCTRKELELPHEGAKPGEFVPALTEEALLNCLTVHDVRELAHFEYPTISNPMELGGRIGPLIEMSPGSLPRGSLAPYVATLAVQVLLFFAVVYFGAFAREAIASPTFPVPGTLFSAFCRSRWTLLTLFVALWVPLCTSVVVAATSRKWTFVVGVLFIGWAVLSVYLVLERKSYFGALNPVFLLRPGKRRGRRGKVGDGNYWGD